jgi:thioesterase domain-containing protein
VPPGPLAQGSVPIGRPIANTTAYVLDGDLAPVPIGVAGELFIGGDGVALGYVNAPELTAERFLPDPWSDRGGRLYRTGDRVRWRTDGALEFLGRMDRQVKVRGYRVEPAEVEAAIAALPNIRDVAVTTPDDPLGGRRLQAYVVTDGAADTAAIRGELAKRLPAHMIPSGFTLLDRLPLGSTGKIDRKNLPLPEAVPEIAKTARVAPATPTEEQLHAIWSRVLEVDDFGTGDGFFDLGGHSLLALKLIHEINTTFGLDLPVRFVIIETTVGRQAAVIDQLRLYAPKQPAPHPLVVPLRAGGTRRPFFLVAGGFGGEAELLVYARLAEHLEDGRPIYGLRIRGVDDLVEPGESVEAIAAGHVAEIRKVQPKGPYFIGGSCVGGVIAFEIAQQLQHQGEEIALLVLVDSTYPNWIWYWRYVSRAWLIDLRSGQLKQKLLDRLEGSRDRAIERRKFQIGRLYLRRILVYSARLFSGKISLIVSEQLRNRDPTRIWKALAADGLIIRAVPGDHVSHLRQHAAETAAALDECLTDAEIHSGR